MLYVLKTLGGYYGKKFIKSLPGKLLIIPKVISKSLAWAIDKIFNTFDSLGLGMDEFIVGGGFLIIGLVCFGLVFTALSMVISSGNSTPKDSNTYQGPVTQRIPSKIVEVDQYYIFFTPENGHKVYTSTTNYQPQDMALISVGDNVTLNENTAGDILTFSDFTSNKYFCIVNSDCDD